MRAYTLKIKDDPVFGTYLCLRDDVVELKITIETGPRIFFFGMRGGKNHFYTDEHAKYTAAGPDHDSYGKGPWRLIGGHRLGIAPEVSPGSVYPDNGAVAWEAAEEGIYLQSGVESWTSLQKSMQICFDGLPGEVTVNHTVYNRGTEPAALSVWPITAMAPGGIAIVPQPDKGMDTEPNRNIALWPYSSFADARVNWGDRFITVGQSERTKWKFGCFNPKGWLAYVNRDEVFIKRFSVDASAIYPDNGSTCEVFTNENLLELETLSPLQLIPPGEKLEFPEKWQLWKTDALHLAEDSIADWGIVKDNHQRES